MARIRRVSSVTDQKSAFLDLLQRVETIEISLKIKTQTDLDNSPMRIYLRSLGLSV